MLFVAVLATMLNTFYRSIPSPTMDCFVPRCLVQYRTHILASEQLRPKMEDDKMGEDEQGERLDKLVVVYTL